MRLSLDERLIRVPFVANRPGFAGNGAPTASRRLPRMLAQHLELDRPPVGRPGRRGRDPTAQFDFVEPDDPASRRAMDSWELDDQREGLLTMPSTCATDGGLKLTMRGHAEELFDLGHRPPRGAPAPPDSHTEQDRVQIAP